MKIGKYEVKLKIEKRKKPFSMTKMVLICYVCAGITFVISELVLGNVLSIVFGLIFLFPVILWVCVGLREEKK